MMTYTAFLLCTFFTFSVSIRIGLPENHVDVSSCLDRACISEQDWYEIGEKWHHFRETVKVINDSRVADIRKAIWQTFQNGNIWNGDERQVFRKMKDIRNMRSFMDKKTEEIQAVQVKDETTRYDHQAIIMMEGDTAVQEAAHFLYNKHPTVSTLYEYSPETDTLQVAAGEEHYLGEHSRVQIVGHGRDIKGVMSLSEKTPQELAQIVRKLPVEMSELSRVSLVGCNVGSAGQSEYLNDGFTEQFLKSLRFDQNIHTEVSSRNGLLSVTATGKKVTGEISTDGIQWFSKDPLSKTVFKLGEFGEIIRAELPVTDRIATYNQESSKALVKITDIDTGKSLRDNVRPVFIEKTNSATGKVEAMKKLDYKDIDEYMETITKSNFLSDIDFVKKKIIDGNAKLIQDTIQNLPSTDNVPEIEIVTTDIERAVIPQRNSQKISYHEFIGKIYLKQPVDNKRISDKFDFNIRINKDGKLKMELISGNKRIETINLESGSSSNLKYVARLNKAYDRVITPEVVHKINSRADLMYEINMLGAFGVDYRNGGTLGRFYQFGDIVYRMARNNFYITLEGMIASNDPVSNKHVEGQRVNENDILNLKPWLWRNSRNQYDYPKGFELESYPEMMNEIQKNYVDRVIDKEIDYQEKRKGRKRVAEKRKYTDISKDDVEFILEEGRHWSKRYRVDYDSGNVLKLMNAFQLGDHESIKRNLVHVLEGSTVLAVGLSEPIRNFRAFSVNEMLMHLNTIEPISLERLIEIHPMTRGNSWGFVGETGMTVSEVGYRPDQLSLVLPRELNIARKFLLSRRGEDGQKNEYKFLTEKEYDQVPMPQRELDKITSHVKKVDILGTIVDFKPESNEPTVRTKPLGNIDTPAITDLESYSDMSSAKAMPIRASVSMIHDYIFVTNYVSKAIAEKNQVTGRNYEIIENSIQVEKGSVKFKVRDKSNNLIEEELNIKIDENLLTTKQIKEEASEKIGEIQETKYMSSKSLTTVNELIGIHGIVMGFRGAVQDFENGKIFEGVMNFAQSVHGIFGMSQTAQRAFQKITSKLIQGGLQEVETGLSVASTEISTALSEGATAVEESITVAGTAAEDIPVLGTVFGVYNTVQDLRRGTAIGYVDAGLDAAIVISALFGPEALVVTVALTIVRLVIDDFYYAISNEIKNLPSDATVLQKIGAVFKGIGEGIVMVLKNIEDVFSFGLISFFEGLERIDKQYVKDHALLHKMSDFHNYFKIKKEEGSHKKLIDFAEAEESWNGGNIIFNMFDDNTARLQMQIVDDNGREEILVKHITLEEGANDIVLGIGESHDVSFKKHSAKILWFIPVHSRYLINKVRGERKTLHGTYYGNSKSNTFFAVQKLPEDSDIGYSLTDYFYEIFGLDGDDVFYLGPQKSIVNGGNGRDTYIIPYTGGKTAINNYATDLKEDVLFIQVNYEQIYVDRIGNDLILKHGHEHDVTVKNWFSGHRNGHMTFKANNGVIFNVKVGVYGKASIVPVAIALMGNTEEHTIDVSRGLWKNVIMVTGSDASDNIIANDNNNLLNGGKGSNTIFGGPGSDTYIINSVAASETSDWNEINNFDSKMTVDKIIFDIPYDQFHVFGLFGLDLLLSSFSNNGPKLRIKNWFASEHYRHMVFVTADDVIFKLSDDINNPVKIYPIILDASNERNGVTLDANKRDFASVSTIIGSDFKDVITGSSGNNYIKGGKGSDLVTGGEGRDVYVIRQEDVGDFINNYAVDEKDDMLLIDFNYNDIAVSLIESDAVLTAFGDRIVTIKHWAIGNSWRHIFIRTIDGISFKLVNVSEFNIEKSAIEIDKSAEVERQEIMIYKKSMWSVEHIIGSNATDVLIGNPRANIIDPGFGGAYMMGLEGHDQYVIMDHYNGPHVVNNFARDNLTDTIKLPTFFNDVQASISGDDIFISSTTSPSAALTLEKYKSDPYRRHVVINTVQDGIIFTMPPSLDFQPTAISIDRRNKAHNLIVDLNSNDTWNYIVEVLGSKEHVNVIRGNENTNTITGGSLSDTLEGGKGNDVIRGNQGDDLIDGGEGDDILAGGAGNDWIDGGMGDDVIYPGPGADHVKGGPGFDVIVLFGDANNMSGVFVDLLNGHGFGGDAHGDIYVSVNGVIGSFYDDLLIGDQYENYLDGKEGNDILYPLDGKDILVGGDGKDMYEISDSNGEKMIRNYAKDGSMDYLNLKLHEMDSIYLERRSNDIVIHIGVYLKDVFCPNLKIGPYHVQQWYKSTSHQHLTVQLADRELVFGNFSTDNLTVQQERPDTNARKVKCDELISQLFSDVDYLDYYDLNRQNESNPEMSSHNESYPEMSSHNESYPEMSSQTESYPEMSSHNESYPEMSSQTESYPEMSSQNKSYPEMSSQNESYPEMSSQNESYPDYHNIYRQTTTAGYPDYYETSSHNESYPDYFDIY